MRVLVVDDDPVGRATLREILALEGYQVEQAAGGREALEKLGSKAFQLMLLDLKMPDVDGLSVLEAVPGKAPDVQVVILTAHGSMESAIQAVRHGAHDYLLKPASTHEILATLARAGERWEELARNRRRLASVEGLASEPHGENAAGEDECLDLGDVRVDVARRRVEGGGTEIELTPAELRLLQALYRERGQVVAYATLVGHVQGYSVEAWEAPGMLRPVVSRVRRKLKAAGVRGEWITTVRGSGYLLTEP
jgi:DNA-binding response OmpR family regulator